MSSLSPPGAGSALSLPVRKPGSGPVAGGGAVTHLTLRASDLPILTPDRPEVIALITRTLGPAYRPAGAAMVFGAEGTVAGNLSSGCIDADIALHATAVRESGRPRDLRYGMGSPFADLALPCGGGLDIRIMPLAGFAALSDLRASVQARRPCDLWLSEAQISDQPFAGADLHLHIRPDIRFLIYGKGPEALAFARMTAGAGYETMLGSPDPDLAPGPGIARLAFPPHPARPQDFPADADTAVTLFFHDHDLEEAVLLPALASGAFYIGAQGSRRTAERRRQTLMAAGASEAQLARLRGPIGLIPSTRDARTLAASVLAEVLSLAIMAD